MALGFGCSAGGGSGEETQRLKPGFLLLSLYTMLHAPLPAPTPSLPTYCGNLNQHILWKP